ncbi:hypothetical protein [Enterovibrio norvegicus]|uniref:hypothetical protein n=1 Tax=Enterovibrio norvegicus TaxID=188144 RepID=UPI00352EA289
MKMIELDVRGGIYKRYYARVATPDRTYYSISIECADYRQRDKDLTHSGKIFNVETCEVRDPEFWVFHDLVHRECIESQNVIPYLGNLLDELKVIEKGVPIMVRWHQFGRTYCETLFNPGHLQRYPQPAIRPDYEYTVAS